MFNVLEYTFDPATGKRKKPTDDEANAISAAKLKARRARANERRRANRAAGSSNQQAIDSTSNVVPYRPVGKAEFPIYPFDQHKILDIPTSSIDTLDRPSETSKSPASHEVVGHPGASSNQREMDSTNVTASEHPVEQSSDYVFDQFEVSTPSKKRATELPRIVDPLIEASTSPSTCKVVDYSAMVLGYEVSPQSPTVQWSCGTITALPFIPAGEESGSNLLERDAAFTLAMASLPITPNELAVWFDTAKLTKSDLIARCRLEISLSRTVVVENHLAPTNAEFNADFFRIELRYQENGRRFDLHDAAKRARGKEPQQPGYLGDILVNTRDHSKIQCILDMPAPGASVPPIVNALDDGFAVGQEIRDLCPRLYAPQDLYDSRSWFLVHTGCFLTYPHHDAAGLCTYIQSLSGAKMWTVYRPKGYVKVKTREELDIQRAKFQEVVATLPGERSGYPVEWEDDCEVATIHLRPGQVIIMPPGTPHAVFTPVRSVAHGGHFLSYESLHLTESARAYDHTNAMFITNTDHVSVGRILSRMAIALVRLSMNQEQKFYRKPIIALCKMVLHPKSYLPNSSDEAVLAHIQTLDREDLGESRAGRLVVDVLIEKLNFGVYVFKDKDTVDYLFEGEEDWTTPGPVIDVATALSGFQLPANLEPPKKKSKRKRR